MQITLVCMLVLVVGFAGLLVQAFRVEQLIAMYWPRHGLFVLEHASAGRYRLISPAWIPLALVRYAALAVAAAAAVVGRRWALWRHAPVVGAKA